MFFWPNVVQIMPLAVKWIYIVWDAKTGNESPWSVVFHYDCKTSLPREYEIMTAGCTNNKLAENDCKD